MNYTPSSACYSPRPPISSLSALLTALLCVAGGPAAFPVSAKDLTDPANAEELKEQWSYLNVLTFGADPTGKEDSTEAIQRALDHARDQSKGILFPLGTYLISDTLRALKIQVQGKHGYWRQTYILTGEDRGDGRRPLIKINPSSDKFNDPDKPRPMLLLALYVMGVERSKEELYAIDPFALKDINDSVRIAGNPTAITARARQLFECSLTGIDFDCGSKPGAVGVSYDAAQKSFLANVKVNATGAHAGFWGIPGRNMGGVNIEVLGGKYGVILTSTTAGATLTGLNLYDQTVSAIDNRDFCPANIVGFHIRKASPPALVIRKAHGISGGSVGLCDGIIELGKQGVAVDNTAGVSFYARNVFVKGSSEFVKSGSQPGVTAPSTKYRVDEYCYNNQTDGQAPYTTGSSVFSTFSLIDGALSRAPEPVKSIEDGQQPPADLVSRHLPKDVPQITFWDSARTKNITLPPYSAVPDDRDNWQAIQRAIDDAEAEAASGGSGNVYVPAGVFQVSKTLMLKPKTRFFGLGCKRTELPLLSAIQAHPNWRSSPQNEALIETTDDPQAGPFFGFMDLYISSAVKYHVRWKAGRNSTMMNPGFYGGVSLATVLLTGNGGGRFYLVEPQSPFGSKDHRHLKFEGTREPFSWYGCNMEAGSTVASNIEIVDSRNIVLYGIKREGKSPTLIISDSENIAVFCQGAMRDGTGAGSGGIIQIRGRSDDILMPLILVQLTKFGSNGEPLLIERLEGKEPVEVIYPDSISIYKRGQFQDLKY